jgi:hypothetical protein
MTITPIKSAAANSGDKPQKDKLTTQLEAAIGNNVQVAVIYDPSKIENKASALNALLRGGSNLPVPANMLTLGIPPEKVEGENEKLPVGYRTDRWIKLVPGTNLGVDPADLMLCKDVPITAAQFKSGVLQVVLPNKGTVENEEQGYHCFSDQDALQLIGMTMHEDWVVKWQAGLTGDRNAIVNAANSQAAELIRVKKERAAA